jgi:hypothetical protein
MKTSIAFGLAAFVAFGIAARPAAAEDGATTWQIRATFSDGGGAVPLCIFQQVGDLLSGTCKGPNSFGTATGSVRGVHVKFTWHAKAYTAIGVSGDIRFSGIQNPPGIVRGTAINPQGASGEFVATRQ